MAGLVPFNQKEQNLSLRGAGSEDFFNVLDDFFKDNWLSGRSLLKDTFKVDIKETDKDYCIEAELPGVKKDEVDLTTEGDILTISVNHKEEKEEKDKEEKNYIHKERRTSSMCRRIRLTDAKLEDVKAKLTDGVLTITIPKDLAASCTHKIDIE